MIEAWADNLKQEKFIDAIQYGIEESQKVVSKIQKSKYLNQTKRKSNKDVKPDRNIYDKLAILTETQLYSILTNSKHDKLSRDDALNDLRISSTAIIQKDIKILTGKEMDSNILNDYYSSIVKKILRKLIFEEGLRCDGRTLTQLRPIRCEMNYLKSLHGSSLFQRGQTQVLCTLTFDSPDTMYGTESVLKMMSPSLTKVDKNFMLHYEFPAYATNTIAASSGRPDRREIGHGALAEKALYPIIPDNNKYTIRLNCEVMESNGSSSMGSVCAGTLALIDAGWLTFFNINNAFF